MTIKIILLKSGEQIISDIMGMFSGENLVKYQMNKPCNVVINGQFQISEKDTSQENQMSVSLYPWPCLSKEDTVEIFADWVVTLVEPTDDLRLMYEEQVLKNGTRQTESVESNQSNIINEQSNIDK